MDNDNQTEIACKLFEQYAALLNQEFHDHINAKKVRYECIAIATQLLKLGFVILADVPCDMETITLSDDMTQTILTFTYKLILVPNQIPVQEPVAYADAISRVFGPVTPKDEAWLHSLLDDLGIDKNPPTEERN